jgi:hypothetical protein
MLVVRAVAAMGAVPAQVGRMVRGVAGVVHRLRESCWVPSIARLRVPFVRGSRAVGMRMRRWLVPMPVRFVHRV